MRQIQLFFDKLKDANLTLTFPRVYLVQFLGDVVARGW